MAMNYDWEITNLYGKVKELDQKLEKKSETLYGNGHEGLTSRVKGLEDEMDEVTGWKKGWEKVTNHDDFRQMKADIQRLVKQSYLLTAIIIVAVFVINLFGPRLSDSILPNKEEKIVERKLEPEIHYIYKNIPRGTAGDESSIPTNKPESEIQKDHMDLYKSAPDKQPVDGE